MAKYSDWLKIDISLRVREIDIENMQTASNNNEFRLHLPGRITYIIYASSKDEKESWVEDISKSIKGEHGNDKTKKKKEEKEKEKKEEEKAASEEEKPERQRKEPKIVINDNEEESDETRTPVDKTRAKIKNRARSEIPTTRIRKAEPVTKQQPQQLTEPETGNLLGFDPFAPQPVVKTPVKTPSNKNKQNKRTKIATSPASDPKIIPNSNPTSPAIIVNNPFQPQQTTPLPMNLSPQQNIFSPTPSFSTGINSNPFTNTPQLLAPPNPFTNTPTIQPLYSNQPLQQPQINPQPVLNNPFITQPVNNTVPNTFAVGFQTPNNFGQGNVFFNANFN